MMAFETGRAQLLENFDDEVREKPCLAAPARLTLQAMSCDFDTATITLNGRRRVACPR
jgi:hypothetical protein